MTTPVVILEKSGRNRYSTPAMAPGNVTARTASATRMIMSMGIRMVVARSMPPETPPRTITTVSSRKTPARATADQGLLVI